MTISSFMEKLDIKRLQVIENYQQGNEFYISPNLSVEQLVSCNSTENNTNQKVELNFADLSNHSLFLNFINEKSIISNPTIALITGLFGVGKSQMLIEIENLFWKQFNINSDYQIVPIKIILSQLDDNLIYATVEQQIQEYFGFDQSQLQQLRQKNNNREVKLILLVDLPYDIQIDQFTIIFQQMESLNQSWHECKAFLSIDQQKINPLKLYNKNYKLPIITFYIELFSESQLNHYLEMNLENQVRKKVRAILEQSLVKSNYSNSANMLIYEITNILLQEVYQKKNEVKKSQKFKKQLKQLSQQSNVTFNFNDIIETFEHELKEIWSVQTYQSILLKYQFNHILNIPLTLKLIVDTLPKIDQMNFLTKQFDVFEKLFKIILEVEKIQQVDFKQIYLFAIQIIETGVFHRDETFESIYELISSLPNNPFKNTKYLNYLWFSNSFVDFFIAYYIHEVVIAIKNEGMEIEVAQQQNLQIQEDDWFFFNKFDSQNLHIYEKIKFECDFDKMIIDSKNYSGVLNLLKEKCWLNRVKVDKLLNIIKASSIIENFEQEAGNAFTILKELKEFYLREDFSQIKLKNFSLDRSQFFQCNFSYSKMDNFTIYNCYFVGCSFDFAEWQEMRNLLLSKQGNRDYIKFSPDNKYVASSYTLDNYGHPKFHIDKQQNSKVVLSFSHDSRHFISKREFKNKSHKISGILIKGKQYFNKKICENFTDADYFTNDHIIVATDNYFRYYSFKNLKQLRKLKADKGKICLSGDHSIQTIVNGNQIEFYNTKTINKIYSLNGKSPCEFAPNNSFIFAFCWEDKIHVMDIQKQQILWAFKVKIDVNLSLAISEDLILVSRCFRNDLFFWDLKKGGELLTILNHNLKVWVDDIKFFNNGNTLRISSDYNILLDFNAIQSNYNFPLCDFDKIALSDKIFVACSKNEEIYFLDHQFGKILGQMPYQFEIVCLQLSYNSNILAIGRLNKSVELWDVQTRKIIQNYANLQNIINQVIFSYDDQLLAVVCDNGVYFYNIKAGRQEHVFKFETVLNSIAFSPDSQSFLIGGSNGQVIQTNLQSLEHKVIYQQYQSIQFVTYTAQVHQMIFSTENEIILWDFQKNKILDKWKSDENFLVQAFNKNFIICLNKFNKKEKYILQFNQNTIQNSKINDFSLNEFSKHDQIALSPNINVLVIAKPYRIVKIIHLNYFNTLKKKLKMVKSIKNQDIDYYYKIPFAICENQNIIASGTEIGHIDLWSALNGQLLLKLAAHTQSVQCLDFHPTQPILASGSMDKTIILWNIESGDLIKKLEGHDNGVISIAFSEDGQFIASGGLDFKVIIWEFETHQIYWEFKGYSSKIVSVSFSPNGKIFAFAEYNKQIHLWDTQNEEFIKTVKFKQQLLWAKFKTNDEFLILTNEEIIQWQINSMGMNFINLNKSKPTAALYSKKQEKLILYGNDRASTYDLIQQKIFDWNYNIIKTIITSISNQTKENQIQQSKDLDLYQSMYAVKDKNNTVTISDIQYNNLTLQIKNYKGFPIASCLSNDQNILALSNWDKCLQLWDLQKDSQICSITNLDIQINHLTFSQKGDLLACRTFQKIIILLNQNLLEVNRFELPDICNSDILISPDSKTIVCVILKGLFIWQVDQSSFIFEINRLRSKLNYYDFSGDNQYLIFYLENDECTFILDIKSKNCCCKISMNKSNIQFIFEVNCFSLPIENKLYQFESVSTRECSIYANLGEFLIDKSIILQDEYDDL